ncbi:Thioredoxin domain-containing protein 5 [Entomophthora muscae]|uniref:Thioredoxin domain-containing protein 5 n=1 Tax=Entomophthora muscae TaxID=34485 RepID=A0ACC2TV47_9FUNG|nr:Thioredoxin domain-containing protein 5 [Entomophthora muscae]
MRLFNFHTRIGLLGVGWVTLAAGQGKDSHVLKPDTFTSTVAKGLWFVKFHSPLCGVCQSLAPIWSEFTSEYSAWGSDNEFHFGEVDCVENTAFCTEAGFEEFPTIVLFKGGERQAGECSFVDSKKTWSNVSMFMKFTTN